MPAARVVIRVSATSRPFRGQKRAISGAATGGDIVASTELNPLTPEELPGACSAYALAPRTASSRLWFRTSSASDLQIRIRASPSTTDTNTDGGRAQSEVHADQLWLVDQVDAELLPDAVADLTGQGEQLVGGGRSPVGQRQ